MAGYDYRTGIYIPFDSVDFMPGDKRFLLASGTFDLAADSTATFWYAVIGAPYGEANQPPGNRDTTELALRCWWAERTFQRLLAVEEPQGPIAGYRQLAAPNPFSPSHTLKIEAVGARDLTADVYDAGGRLIRSLAGQGRLTWDGRGQSGRMLPAGLYFVTVRTSIEAVTHKVLLQH